MGNVRGWDVQHPLVRNHDCLLSTLLRVMLVVVLLTNGMVVVQLQHISCTSYNCRAVAEMLVISGFLSARSSRLCFRDFTDDKIVKPRLHLIVSESDLKLKQQRNVVIRRVRCLSWNKIAVSMHVNLVKILEGSLVHGIDGLDGRVNAGRGYLLPAGPPRSEKTQKMGYYAA